MKRLDVSIKCSIFGIVSKKSRRSLILGRNDIALLVEDRPRAGQASKRMLQFGGNSSPSVCEPRRCCIAQPKAKRPIANQKIGRYLRGLVAHGHVDQTGFKGQDHERTAHPITAASCTASGERWIKSKNSPEWSSKFHFRACYMQGSPRPPIFDNAASAWRGRISLPQCTRVLA
jgi:hypothetical protein